MMEKDECDRGDANEAAQVARDLHGEVARLATLVDTAEVRPWPTDDSPFV